MAQTTPLDRRVVPPIVVVFGLAGIVVAGIAVLSFLAGFHWQLFKVGEESNVPTWYSSVQLFTIALVFAPLVIRDGGVRPLLWSVPGLFLLLSLDEVAMLHERLGRWLAAVGVGEGVRTGPWFFAWVPIVGIVALVALAAIHPYLRSRPRVAGLLLAAAAIYGGSAVGLEVVANLVPPGSLAEKGLGFAEEYGEMLGATLFLWAAVEVHRAERLAFTV